MGYHAIITGASAGIGAALAHELSRHGYSVGLIARRADKLDEVAASVRASGGQAAVATADVTDREGLAAAIASLEAEQGPCEVLVCNAGVIGLQYADTFNAEDVVHIMNVNFNGCVYGVEAVLPGMLARGRGQLVAISSVAGMRGLPTWSAYSASKSAVSTFWESLRVELKPRGIQCTTVQPGFIDTDLVKGNKNPMPFLLSPEELSRRVAGAIQRRDGEFTVPWQMEGLMWLTRRLPNWLYDRVMYSNVPKSRRGPRKE
ncbi:MAG: SDR family NAD(P)-dependent oxidoreductase [Proteobacteria bacterium]|nr:SDR family NAD(P)-dependent oxidoreductase [Pseudomonadota bacterium]MCP4917246.1 SDR family NAD(P)-dependent oxidoreductase [Pseudomonadota bacterium]